MPGSARRLLRRLGLLAGALILAAYAGIVAVFQLSRHRMLSALDVAGRVVQTAAGPIELARDGAGPTVLVVPGTFGGFDQARATGADLHASGFAILAVSRPGYLRTPIAVGRTPRAQADALAALLDALGLERVGVLAVSGGGPAALELAAAHPDRVWGLVMVSALSGSKDQPPARLPAYTAVTDRLFGDGFSTWWQLRSYVRTGLAVTEAPIFGEGSRRALAASPSKLERFFELAWFRFPPSRRWAGYLNDRAEFERFQFDRFERVSAPTLVVHGTEDRNVPVEHGDRTAGRIPGAEYLRIDGGDHYLAIAAAETVWPAVASFLRRHAPEP